MEFKKVIEFSPVHASRSIAELASEIWSLDMSVPTARVSLQGLGFRVLP